jgi:hypothetical protein
MLDNTITLDVNDDNDDGTTATVEEVYSRWQTLENRSIFHNAAHSLEMRKKLDVYRTPARANGNYRGSSKQSFKFTEDGSYAGMDSTTTIISPKIVEFKTSFPVGSTEEEKVALIMEAVSFASSVDGIKLMTAQDI